MENEAASALTIYNTKKETLTKKSDTQRGAKNILPLSLTGNNPANYDPNSSIFFEALKTVISLLFQYHGSTKNRPVHKKFLNLIWALFLNKIEAS